MLNHWNNSPWIDTSPKTETWSLFRANQSLLFHLNDVNNLIWSLLFHAYWWNNKYHFYRSVIEPTIYRIRDEHANHYTTDAVDLFLYRCINCNTETCIDPLDKTCLQIKFQNTITVTVFWNIICRHTLTFQTCLGETLVTNLWHGCGLLRFTPPIQ